MKIWYVIFFVVIFVACTDYVNQIEDERDDWRDSQELATLSSSNRPVSSSSVIPKILGSSSSSAKSSSSQQPVLNSSETKTSSSSSILSHSSSSDILCSDSREEMSSSEDIASSSSNVNLEDLSSSSEKIELSSSGKASWTYLNPAISYDEMMDNRDGQVYKIVVIDGRTWMAENLNYEIGDSYCYNDSTTYCDKYGRLYAWQAAKNACPTDWRLPTIDEWNALKAFVETYSIVGTALKSMSGWGDDGNGVDAFGFSAIPAGGRFKENHYDGEGAYTFFWSSTQFSSDGVYSMGLYRSLDGFSLGTSLENERSIRCIKDGEESTESSSSIMSLSSSSKASWVYLNPMISYGEMTDNRDGQVYKTVVIDGQTWMAENLNYESIKSYCYENKIDSCFKYGRLYTWSAAMDSVGVFSTNSKGCGYPQECYYSKTPVQGVCPEKWHLPSQQEWYDLSTYNSSTISGDLSSAGERLKSTNGWFNSGNGDDTYGFSVLPAGIGAEDSYSKSGEKTCFWSSSDGNGIDAYGIHFEYSNSKGVLQGTIKYAGCSVRCVKD